MDMNGDEGNVVSGEHDGSRIDCEYQSAGEVKEVGMAKRDGKWW